MARRVSALAPAGWADGAFRSAPPLERSRIGASAPPSGSSIETTATAVSSAFCGSVLAAVVCAPGWPPPLASWRALLSPLPLFEPLSAVVVLASGVVAFAVGPAPRARRAR